MNIYTPTERLIVLALTVNNQGQTAEQLQTTTATKSDQSFRRALRTLIMASVITLNETGATYQLASK